jgi:hypothetical protein
VHTICYDANLYQLNCSAVLNAWQLAHLTSHLAISCLILSSPNPIILDTLCDFSEGLRWSNCRHATLDSPQTMQGVLER